MDWTTLLWQIKLYFGEAFNEEADVRKAEIQLESITDSVIMQPDILAEAGLGS